MNAESRDYLSDNVRLARRLLGAQLCEVTRLLDAPMDDDDDVLTVYGPVLLGSESGEQWLIDVEESKSNILLLDPAASDGLRGPWYSGFTLREPIVDPSAEGPLSFLLSAPIMAIDVISREPEPGVPDSFSMCGLRLGTTQGQQVCVGTALTELRTQQVAFRLPDEVDSELLYRPL